LTQSQASNKPKRFLKEGVERKTENSAFLNQHLKKFKQLAKKLTRSSNTIFLHQKSLQRVDHIYKEHNYYWTYLIPEDSPFPLSNKTEILTNEKFSNEQKAILQLLSELNIYAVCKSDNGGMYLLIDGFTDNSYGFYFNANGLMETDNNLFQIMAYEKVNSNFFYYVAN